MAELNTSNGEVTPSPMEVHIDVDELANSMTQKLEELSQSGQPNQNEPLTIFRIPEYIRHKHEALYEPQIISIGPYHHGAKSLQPMEEQKWRSLQQLLQDTAHCSLNELVKHVRSLEAQARSAYKENGSLPASDEFVKMMILDACFLIHFLSHLDHRIVASDISAMLSDLLLLENQIPFFIINTVYYKIFPNEQEGHIYSLLANFMFTFCDFKELEQPDEDPVHLVHLYYEWFLLRAHTPTIGNNSFLQRTQSLLWHQFQLPSIIERICSFRSQLFSSESSIQSSSYSSDQTFFSGHHNPPEQGTELFQHSPQLPPHQSSTDTRLPRISHPSTFQSEPFSPPKLEVKLHYSKSKAKHRNGFVHTEETIQHSPEHPRHQAPAAHLYTDSSDTFHSLQHNSPKRARHQTSNKYLHTDSSDTFASLQRTPVLLLPLPDQYYIVPTVKVTTTAPIKVIPSATTLREAGIKFKRRTSYGNLFRITFNKGVIEISSIILDNNRKRLFLNLIALEQSQVEWKKDLTSFTKLMDMLIDSPKDVAILEKCGIVHNLLASAEEATHFFNQISEFAAVDYNNYLDKLIKEVREFNDSKWHRRRAKLMRDYFNSPWSVISFIGGIILLIFTFLQVYFAIYPNQ